MTQKEMYAHIAQVMANEPEVVEFCEKKLEQLNRPRKKKVNESILAIGEHVTEHLHHADEAMTNKQLTEWYNTHIADTDEDKVSAQKMAAVLRHLVGTEVVTKTIGEKTSDPAQYSID